jgi:hypothetical protein
MCVVDHAAENFDRGKLPSNLAMFRLAVGKLEDGMAKDSHLMDKGCGRHSFATDEAFWAYLAIRKAQAEAKQEVLAYIKVR